MGSPNPGQHGQRQQWHELCEGGGLAGAFAGGEIGAEIGAAAGPWGAGALGLAGAIG